ncbi:helix-turn-helix transcriptional regulator [Sphingobacterium siyangense]|uniref:helix-turn-helix transcriptional regulator n=1 Tax=Sphingobacterium siyangense TaxID=459529 RepID=UPI003DA38461
MVDELVFYSMIGKQIADLREKQGLTQDKLGQRLGLSRVSIVNIEKGRQKPTLYLLYTLSQIFNVNIFEIAGEIGVNASYAPIKSGKDDFTNKDRSDLDQFLKKD